MMAIYESGSRPLAGTEFLIMLVLRFPASGTMKQAPSGQNTQSLRNHLTFFNWWRRHPQTCTRAYGAAPGGIIPWRYTSLRYVHGGQINRDGISWSLSCAKNSIYCKEFQWLLLFRMWYMLFSIPTPIVCHCCYYLQPVFLSYPGYISARQPNLTAGGRTIRNYVWTPRRGAHRRLQHPEASWLFLFGWHDFFMWSQAFVKVPIAGKYEWMPRCQRGGLQGMCWWLPSTQVP